MPHQTLIINHAARVYSSAAERLADWPLPLAPLPGAEDLPAWVGEWHEGISVIGLAFSAAAGLVLLALLWDVGRKGAVTNRESPAVALMLLALLFYGAGCGLAGLYLACIPALAMTVWLAWRYVLLPVARGAYLIVKGL